MADKQKKHHSFQAINVISSELFDQQTEIAELALSLSKAVSLAKYLGNEPANIMTPALLAATGKEKLEPLGVKVKIYGQAEIEKFGMTSYLNVAKGSTLEPQLLVMEYKNNPNSNNLIALVGKGLTFDSGGYSIKPTDGMLTMKSDMCGAAAVIGAMHYLADTKAAVNVVAVVAACENMISGGAYKPGDIIGSMGGKFIEINNTDAEGRLTLADAVYFAHDQLQATHIIDICTLTGACIVALGDEITGVLTDNETMWQAIDQAAQISGDKIWRMPCDEDMVAGLKSEVADLKNTGPRGGGMITAGLFVREFTANKPWLHLDIAGPSFQNRANGFYPQGATGVGVEYLAELTKFLDK